MLESDPLCAERRASSFPDTEISADCAVINKCDRLALDKINHSNIFRASKKRKKEKKRNENYQCFRRFREWFLLFFFESERTAPTGVMPEITSHFLGIFWWGDSRSVALIFQLFSLSSPCTQFQSAWVPFWQVHSYITPLAFQGKFIESFRKYSCYLVIPATAFWWWTFILAGWTVRLYQVLWNNNILYINRRIYLCYEILLWNNETTVILEVV